MKQPVPFTTKLLVAAACRGKCQGEERGPVNRAPFSGGDKNRIELSSPPPLLRNVHEKPPSKQLHK